MRRPIVCLLQSLFAAVIVLIAAAEATAQVSTGGLRGIVRDSSNAILVGVTVEASSPARIGPPAVEVTNDQGLYRFDNLPIGEYTVTFTLQGFDTLWREGVRVEVGRSIELTATMSVGAVEQSVMVKGESPVVDTTHAGYSSNFNQQLLENIPTTRTIWFDVVTAAPAVRSGRISRWVRACCACRWTSRTCSTATRHSASTTSSHTVTYLEPTAIFLPRRAIIGVRYNF